MSELSEQRTTVVFKNVKDENGTMWRAVTLTDDGGFAIRGHDIGPGVEEFLGCSEYEFEGRLTPSETAQLRTLLVAGGDGLLKAVVERFASTHELEEFLAAHGITGTLWSRTGD